MNSEYLQLLRYERDNSIKSTTITFRTNLSVLPRILTFFFYLNDLEENMGGFYSQVNLTVTPKKAGAVLGPSV
jgi:hypothetical protein